MDCTNKPDKPKIGKGKKYISLKLTLWHTRTFTPIFTHRKLERIMASIGFFPLVQSHTSTDSLMKELEVQAGTKSAVRENDGVNVELGQNLQEDKVALTCTKSVQWREYTFKGTNLITGSGLHTEMRPRPRLPYPRVDGLHFMSYLAFFAALECYIHPNVVVNLFDIRPMRMNLRDVVYKTVYKQIMNFHVNPEIEGAMSYFYREDTLDDASEERYGRLKASVGNVSCNDISKMCVRKDGTRKIEEDERDDSSDFVCLIDDADLLYIDGYHGELSRDESLVGAIDNSRRDDRENGEACCNFSFVNLSDLIGGAWQG